MSLVFSTPFVSVRPSARQWKYICSSLHGKRAAQNSLWKKGSAWLLAWLRWGMCQPVHPTTVHDIIHSFAMEAAAVLCVLWRAWWMVEKSSDGRLSLSLSLSYSHTHALKRETMGGRERERELRVLANACLDWSESLSARKQTAHHLEKKWISPHPKNLGLFFAAK